MDFSTSSTLLKMLYSGYCTSFVSEAIPMCFCSRSMGQQSSVIAHATPECALVSSDSSGSSFCVDAEEAKRMEAYHQVTSVFGVLQQLKYLTAEEILKRSSNIISAFPDNLEESLGNELVQFTELLKADVAVGIGNKKH